MIAVGRNEDMKNKYAIFDMDGLMFDTERVFIKAWDYAGARMRLILKPLQRPTLKKFTRHLRSSPIKRMTA